MRPLIQEIQTAHTPETLAAQLLFDELERRSPTRRVDDVPKLAGSETGAPSSNVVLLRTSAFDLPSARYSFVAANPFLTFRSFGSRCEIAWPESQISNLKSQIQYGDPWHLLDSLMSRFELLDEIDLPFPLGGCFGFWGYDLKNFTEPKLPRRAANDLELPDCHVGFYDSLVVFDHQLGKVFIVSTGLSADGSRSESRAKEQLEFWRVQLADGAPSTISASWNSGFSLSAGQAKLDSNKTSRAGARRSNFQCFPGRIYCRRRTRPALHPRRRHLSGEFVAPADGGFFGGAPVPRQARWSSRFSGSGGQAQA